MAEKHVAETKEMVDTILKNLKKYEGWCSCSNYGYEQNLSSKILSKTNR
jgi:hypothetical protein